MVYIRVEALDLAVPIDLLFDHTPGSRDLLRFTGPLRIWAVAGDIQPGRCERPDGIDHLAQRVGAPPGNEKKGRVYSHVA